MPSQPHTGVGRVGTVRGVDRLDLAAIRRAVDVVAPVAKRTPVVSSVSLSQRYGGTVVLKAENLQATGSFKIRGASTKVAALRRCRSCRRCHRSERRQPRPGDRLCRPTCRAGMRDLRPRRCRDQQDRGVAGARRRRRRGRSDARRRRRRAPAPAPSSRATRSATRSTTLTSSSDRAPSDSSWSTSSTTSPPCSSRSVAEGWPSGVAIAVKSQRPDVRVIGIQAEACAPYAGGETPRRAPSPPSPTASPSSTPGRSPAR